MEIKTIFGLPAHILIVHAAVVLVPLAAIAVILISCVPRWRSSHALLGALFSASAVTAVSLASQTGESLEESVKRTDLVRRHIQQSESVLPFTIGLVVIAGVWLLIGIAEWKQFDIYRMIKMSRPVITKLLVVGAIFFGVTSTYFVIQVGHSGARATWNTVQIDGK